MRNEKGMAMVLIAVMVLIILVLGFVSGYYYFKNNESKTTPVATTNSTKTTSSPIASKTSTSTSTPTSTATAFNEATAIKESCKATFPNCKTTIADAKVDECVCQVDKINEKFAIGNNFVKLTETGGPGAAFIAAKVGSAWILVQTTQDMWLCAKLNEYNVSKDFINGKCYDTITQKTIDY